MYKLLLCWRYLWTRYIAFICIICVMLGVATLIVVNSVMAGFAHEMRARMNGVLGDIILQVRSMDGVPDAPAHMRRIKEVAGDAIVGMSPTIQVPALMYVELNGQLLTSQIMLVGIDEQTHAQVSAFGEYLQHPENREKLSFALREGGYDVYDHQAEDSSELKPRLAMHDAGWKHRRRYAAQKKMRLQAYERLHSTADEADAQDPFAQLEAQSGEQTEGRDFDPATETHTGIVLGMGVCNFRDAQGNDNFRVLPGDDIRVSYPKASLPPEAISEFYTVVDFYESKMSEFDTSFAFVPLRQLQLSRGMFDPQTGVGKFTSIRIKLREGENANEIRDRLQDEFSQDYYVVYTWQDQQGPLLHAVQTETLVLNVLLFMIIAVAGFGILAIFYMIVVEKTRDIGILKSLGASGRGVMGIFLGYGLTLGIVGSGIGLVLGLMFERNLNEIADALGRLTGTPVFDPSVYYFHKIPTIVEPFTLLWICLGAVGIAVMASVLPARRAASLHPVRALRYE